MFSGNETKHTTQKPWQHWYSDPNFVSGVVPLAGKFGKYLINRCDCLNQQLRMGDNIQEPGRNHIRFFCHRCMVEYEDDGQNDSCIFCAMGFIEQIENTTRSTIPQSLQESEFSDAEMSNLDYAGGHDDSAHDVSLEIPSYPIVTGTRPLLNDLAFLTGGQGRGGRPPGIVRPPRSETLMDQLVWILGAGREGAGAGTAGPPFVLVGALGDYVFGGEGLDTVVTQILGQIENSGPPPLPTEQISTIPSELITAAQVEANMSCCICSDVFTLDESVSRLECTHIFHQACITRWLELHATCPICRHSLLAIATPLPRTTATPETPAQQMPVAPESPAADSGTNNATPPTTHTVIAPEGEPSSSSRGPGLSRLWAQVSSSINILANVDSSSSSMNSGDTSRFIDIDFD